MVDFLPLDQIDSSVITQLLVAHTLTTPKAIHQLCMDVRFWMPNGLDLEVKSNEQTVISFMDPNCPKPKCQHHQYGIWLRLQFKRKLITSCCRKRRRKLDYGKELATPSSNSSSESQSVKDLNPPDVKYAEDFDRLTAGHKNRIPKCVLRSPTFEEQHGMSSTAAMQLMQDSMHPLDWFGRVKASYLEAPMQFTSHQQEFHHAFIIVSFILFKMGLPRNPLGDQQGAYTQEPQGEETQTQAPYGVPTVIDTGASFSLTQHKSDFVELTEKPDIDKLCGLSAASKVEGVGWVEWKI
jgi:hypothetical protein